MFPYNTDIHTVVYCLMKVKKSDMVMWVYSMLNVTTILPYFSNCDISKCFRIGEQWFSYSL